MKKTMLLAWAMTMIIAFRLEAQDSTQTLIKWKRPTSFGLYIAPEFQYGQINSEFTPMGGASFMFLLDNRFGIGGTMMHTLDRSFSPSGISPLVMRAGYGGLKLEYTLKPHKLVHLSIPLVIGAGFASADSAGTFDRPRDPDGNYHHGGFRNGNRYVVIQPGLQLETNLIRYARLFVGANYRFGISTDSNNAQVPNDALTGFSANIGLKVGLFQIPLKNRHRDREHPE